MSGLGLALLLLAAACVPLAVALRRSTELFVLEVDAGTARLRRGRLPQRLLNDINDVVGRPPVARAQVRVVVDDGQPRVMIRGSLPQAQVQQLRNVVGCYRTAQIRAGQRRARR